MGSVQIILFGGVLVWMSSYAIYRGFVFLKQKRVIADTPTSNIVTAAIGNSVEVKGRCVSLNNGVEMISPLFNQKCIGYLWIIEKYKKRGKNSKWVETGRFYSDQYLKVKDRSGKSVLVRFDELNFDFWRTKKQAKLKSLFSQPHKGIMKVIDQYPVLGNYIKYKEILGAYRVKEYCILPFHNIYLLGEAANINTIADLELLNHRNKVFGDAYNFKKYSYDLSDVQFVMKKSQKFGDILKIDNVFISNFRENDLIKRIALKAYALIGLGGIALSSSIYFYFFSSFFT